jgi:hypothetical protein
MKEDLTDEKFEEWARNSEAELCLVRVKVVEQIKELNELLSELL